MAWELLGGKGQEVQEMTDGKGLCICFHNADVSSICGANFREGDLEYLIDQFGEGRREITLKELRAERPGATNKAGCDYCYAMQTNVGKVFTPRTIGTELTTEDRNDMYRSFAKLQPNHVRIGKSTEPGYRHTRERLAFLLELCQGGMGRHAAQPIIITKTLGTANFDEPVYDLVAKARGSVLWSLGKDASESGPVDQGFTNEWRLEQAIAAQQRWGDRVSVGVTVVADTSLSMEDNIAAGFYGPTAIPIAQQHGVYTRVISIRYTGRENPANTHGKSRSELTTHGRSLFEEEEGVLMERRGNAQLICPTVHNDWEPWAAGNMACGIMGDGYDESGRGQYREQCDHCALPNADGSAFRAAVPIPRDNLVASARRIKQSEPKKTPITVGRQETGLFE